MKHGDLVTTSIRGDYGKPRPALVVQDDAFSELAAVTVLRLTSELDDWPLFRITIEPTPEVRLAETLASDDRPGDCHAAAEGGAGVRPLSAATT